MLCLGVPCVRLFVVIWMRFSEVISFTLTIPLLPFYVQHLLGNVPDTDPRIEYFATLAFGGQNLCEAFSSFFLGWFSDRYGRRPVMILGLVFTVISSFLCAFAVNVPMLVASRWLRGLGNANLGVTKTYLTELVTDGDNRQKVFDIFVTISGFGFAIGPALAALATPSKWLPALAPPGSILDRFPFALPFCLVGSVSIFTLVLSIFCLSETHPRLRKRSAADAETATWRGASVQSDAARDRTEALLPNDAAAAAAAIAAAEPTTSRADPAAPGARACADDPSLPLPPSFRYRTTTLVVVVSLYLLLGLQEIIYITLFALWAKLPPSASGLGWSLQRIGFAQSFCGAGMCAAMPVSHLFRKCLGPIWRGRLGVLLPAACIAATPFLTSMPAILAVQATAWIGYAPVFSVCILLINNSAPSTLLGRINGISQTCVGLIRFFGPLGAGALIVWLSRMPPPWDCRVAFLGTSAIVLLYLGATCALPKSIEQPFDHVARLHATGTGNAVPQEPHRRVQESQP